jgi:hypothetical protein
VQIEADRVTIRETEETESTGVDAIPIKKISLFLFDADTRGHARLYVYKAIRPCRGARLAPFEIFNLR